MRLNQGSVRKYLDEQNFKESTRNKWKIKFNRMVLKSNNLKELKLRYKST